MTRRYILGDVETSGLSAEAGVVEIAWLEIDESLNVLDERHSLIDPQHPIEPGASGVHHITDDMVADSPTFDEYFEHIYGGWIEGDIILIAHNSPFDRRFFAPACRSLNGEIDTLRLARKLIPEAQNHKLQTLRYMFKLDAGTAHSAMGDVKALYNLLTLLLQKADASLEDLIKITNEPLFVHTMPFGKHRGKPITEVPRDYFQWLMKQDNVDPDLMYTMKRVIAEL